MSTARVVLHSAHVEGYDGVKPSKRPHYLTLVASNGRVLATSELYANKSSATRAAGDWYAAFLSVIEAHYGGAPVFVEAKPARMKAASR